MNIRIEDLFYIYQTNDEPFVALRGLHLNIKSGECLVIRGPNGSGKSTLVKILTGFLVPTAGSIAFDERDISTIDPLRLRREYVASIDQRGNLLEDISIGGNIALAFALTGESPKESKAHARASLVEYGYLPLESRYPNQLSAGERQFISLLAAQATNPKILIADEPSGDLDNQSALKMYEMLKAMARNTNVLLVTHDSRAEQYADRVVRIRDGRVSEEWIPGHAEESVVDPYGWMRVRDVGLSAPRHHRQSLSKLRTPLVRAQELGLAYGEKAIFSNISFDGAPGELIALSSSSGSGKSSLLRILAGIQDPTSGSLSIGGVELSTIDRKARAELRGRTIGYLGQERNAVENISLADHLGNPQLDAIFGEKSNKPLSNFSGGERARIELLKVLAGDRPLLILDEPTSQMDDRRSQEAAEMILNKVSEGTLVIVSTRDEILLAEADRIIGDRLI